MYRQNNLSILFIGPLCTVIFCAAAPFGCGAQPADPNGSTSFDGAWVWYEDDEPLYNIVIEAGEITSLESTGRNAKGLRYIRSITGVDSRDGLTHLSFVEGDGSRIVQFRFDQDSRGCTSDEMCPGIRSENVYSKVDEIMMRISSVAGELVRK